jgi:hypothetical protein
MALLSNGLTKMPSGRRRSRCVFRLESGRPGEFTTCITRKWAFGFHCPEPKTAGERDCNAPAPTETLRRFGGRVIGMIRLANVALLPNVFLAGGESCAAVGEIVLRALVFWQGSREQVLAGSRPFGHLNLTPIRFSLRQMT